MDSTAKLAREAIKAKRPSIRTDLLTDSEAVRLADYYVGKKWRKG